MDERIRVLENRVRILTAMVILGFGLASLTIVLLTVRSSSPDVLRVRRLSVIDAEGRERIVIAAPVPDPVVQGERRPRSGPISGVVLMDPSGNERAGFATSDFTPSEVFLGLDSDMRQEARLIVNPGGGGHLSFFDQDGNYARIGIWPGRPTLFLRARGDTVFQAP